MSRCDHKYLFVNKSRPCHDQVMTTTDQDLMRHDPPVMLSFLRLRHKKSKNDKITFFGHKCEIGKTGVLTPRGGTPRGGLPPYQRLINSENGKITLPKDGFGVKI